MKSTAIQALDELLTQVSNRETHGWIDAQRQAAAVMALEEAIAQVEHAEQRVLQDGISKMLRTLADRKVPETLQEAVSGPSLRDRIIETPSMLPEFPEPHIAVIGG